MFYDDIEWMIRYNTRATNQDLRVSGQVYAEDNFTQFNLRICSLPSELKLRVTSYIEDIYNSHNSMVIVLGLYSHCNTKLSRITFSMNDDVNQIITKFFQGRRANINTSELLHCFSDEMKQSVKYMINQVINKALHIAQHLKIEEEIHNE